MPVFDSTTRDKIDDLRALRAAGTATEPYELLKINWPSPDGAIYYAVIPVDEVASVPPSVSPIDTRIIPEDSVRWFLPFKIDSSIGDEELEVSFWDGDDVFSQLIADHGEGIKCEVFFYFPQVELLLPQWHGHLRFEDDAEASIVKVKIAQGFRSSDSSIPSRAHYQECQAVFGGLLATQADIDEHDCPYNLHIGGGIGTNDPDTSNPWTFCDRRNLTSCTDRGVDPLHHLSHRSVQLVTINNQTSGPRLYSTSHGNETNLKEPVRVVMGSRRIRDMKVMAFRKDLNTNNPEHGWFDALYEACEGPIEAILNPIINVGGVFQNAQAQYYGYRLGNKIDLPVNNTLSTHGYSGTAHIRYIFGWVNPATIEPDEATASVIIHGLRNIRIYSDQDTYTEGWSNNRVWHIARMLCDKRWGYGYDYDRLNMESFIAAAEWASAGVRFTDPLGNTWDHIRAMSDVELIERKVQQQVEDICMAGFLSKPFIFDGQIHIEPLRALTEDELDDCPIFTDEGEDKNIIHEEIEEGAWKSTLRWSRKSDLDLPNRVECTFDDAENNHLERPAAPVEDVGAQLRAGTVVGDKARKINIKKYNLMGVVVENHAMKCSWGILDRGEFDEGGLSNNLRLKFRVWFADAIDLYPSKVVKVVSSKLTKYGFTFFRILDMDKSGGLEYELTLQAYNETYMAAFETLISTLPGPPPEPVPPEPPGPEPSPCTLQFGTISYVDGVLSIPVQPC
jgi:hypothetical protein